MKKTLFSQHIPFASVNQKDDQLRESGDRSDKRNAPWYRGVISSAKAGK